MDRARLPAYLESTNPRNVSLYERHGFRVTTSIDLPGGPPLTAMWRPPPGTNEMLDDLTRDIARRHDLWK